MEKYVLIFRRRHQGIIAMYHHEHKTGDFKNTNKTFLFYLRISIKAFKYNLFMLNRYLRSIS